MESLQLYVHSRIVRRWKICGQVFMAKKEQRNEYSGRHVKKYFVNTAFSKMMRLRANRGIIISDTVTYHLSSVQNPFSFH